MSPKYKSSNKIMECDNAGKSYKKLNREEKGCIDARIHMLLDRGLRFNDQIEFYPKHRIYAIKKKRKFFNLRVYGFFDNNVFFISHYVRKKTQKLNIRDVNRVLKCRKGMNK